MYSMALRRFGAIAILIALIGRTCGHGAHEDLPATGDWATDHMRRMIMNNLALCFVFMITQPVAGWLTYD